MGITKGKDVVFAVRVPDDQTLRVLYQTDGGRSKEREEEEINTKDIDAVAYGKKTETISFEGLLSNEDPALKSLEQAIDDAEYAEILEINTKTLEAKVGMYMVSNFDVTFPNDESATYSFDAKIIGNTRNETLTEVPEGATEV